MMDGEKRQKRRGNKKKSPGRLAGASALLDAGAYVKNYGTRNPFLLHIPSNIKAQKYAQEKLHGRLRTIARAIEHKRATD